MVFLSRICLLLCLAGACLTPKAFSQTPPPAIFYSDLDSGPSTGGENGGGVYVTLYGNYFGASGTVSVGGVQATVYKQWGAPWLWYQKISFQIPPTAAQGTTSITVTNANGKSNSFPFTIRSGKIYFVAVNGNNNNPGTFGSPWQTISQCKASMAAGDTCYVENGVTQTSDDYSSALVLGSPGAPNAYKALIVYPGQSATIGTVNGNRGVLPCSGLSSCPGSDGGSYWVVAGFNLRGSEAVYITGVHDLKFVGNNVQCPNGDGASSCFGTESSQNFRFYGNEVTNAGIVNASKLYHSMYFTTNSNHIEVAWGAVHDSHACRGIQFHSTGGNQQYDLSVHDELIYNIRCDGINFATVDPSKGKVEAYNNVIFNAGIGPDPPDGAANYSCIYVPAGTPYVGPSGSGTVDIYNNTLYNCGTWDQSYGGAITIGPGDPIYVRLRNNLIRQDNGIAYIGSASNKSYLLGSNNLYFGNGAGPSQTSSNVNADPLFASATGKNFQLQTGSPAIDAGTAISSLKFDRSGVVRPQGKSLDIGAYEYFGGSAGSSPPPPSTSACDLNADGVVNQADVQMAVNEVIGVSACGSADLQENGKCSVVDVQRIVNASLGQSCRVGP